MSFLSAKSQANFDAIGDIVDQEVARTKRSSGLETTRFRQAHYIVFCKINEINDPCGYQDGYIRILGYYVKYSIMFHNCRSATARGYLEAVNVLFEKRNLPLPYVSSDDKQNLPALLVENLKKEEKIANQRNPLTVQIFARTKIEASTSQPHSIKSGVFDWTCLNTILGCHC